MRNCVSRRVVVPTGGREAMVGGRTFSLGKYISLFTMLHKHEVVVIDLSPRMRVYFRWGQKCELPPSYIAL